MSVLIPTTSLNLHKNFALQYHDDKRLRTTIFNKTLQRRALNSSELNLMKGQEGLAMDLLRKAPPRHPQHSSLPSQGGRVWAKCATGCE